MIAVIFEVFVADGRRQEYLDIAADIRPLVEMLDGFISIERFQSLNDPEKLLSLSLWRDEEAVKAWREQAAHVEAQHRGRAGVFKDYRIRVVSVIRDYGMFERTQAQNHAE
jgi:heme-degrading monooxygenase HmoA